MYTPMGVYDHNKAGHEESYYIQRHCNIDYRGLLKVSPLSYFGFFVTVITASHDIASGQFTNVMTLKQVVVGDYAWICSNAILYDCEVMHHAIVSIGAVVTNQMVVQPYTIVAGNPAIVIAEWDGTKWKGR